MSSFGEYKHVVTKKEHQCVYCNRIIPKGIKAGNYKGMFEGHWQNWYSCGYCEKHVAPNYADGNDFISGDEFSQHFHDDLLVCSNKCMPNYSDWEWDKTKTQIQVHCSKCNNEYIIDVPFVIE